MTMVTDPARQYRTDPGHPEICNVFHLHKHFSPDPEAIVQIEADCRSAAIGCVEHKKWFAKDLADYFAPFRARRAELAADPDDVWEVLADGAARAQVIAAETLAEVKEKVGLP
jgi:tryptophanyl-tRNA synthetase